jgi:hypothetical protein
MTFAGSNADVFAKLQEAKLNPTGRRYYFNASVRPGPIPRHWPNIDGNPARACVSIRPNLEEVIKGHLNGALTSFMRQAPRGPVSLLGLWHEASYLKYPGITGEQLRKAQKHIQKLSHDIGANVKVGAIDIVDIAHPGVWMAPGLDFYACDIFDNKTCDGKPYEMLGRFKAKCEKLNAAHGFGPATICVAETNSHCRARRPFWFQTVWSWLQTQGFTSDRSCFLTYWRDKGPESGAWDPGDKAVIRALRTIFEKSAP